MPAPCAKVSTSGIKSSASVQESTHSGPSGSDPCVNPSSETCRPAIIFLVIVVPLCFQNQINRSTVLSISPVCPTFEFTRSRKRAKPAVASRVQRRVRPHGCSAALGCCLSEVHGNEESRCRKDL